MVRKLTPDEKLAYILLILRHTTLPKPDYRAAALHLGMPTAALAQIKFRGIIKSAGFDLVKDQIVEGTSPSAPAHPDHGVGRQFRGRRGKRTIGGSATDVEEAETINASMTRSSEGAETREPPKKKRRLNDNQFSPGPSTVNNADHSSKGEESKAVEGLSTVDKNNAERGFIVLGKNGGIRHFSCTSQALQSLEGCR